jgi:chemotaxis protein CheX
MDVKYLNPFIKSTVETFRIMMKTEITPGAPMIKKPNTPISDISAVIGLSGDAQGTIALSFEQNIALLIVSKLLGVSIHEVGQDLNDGIGEIVNIIAGYAKKDLTEFNLSISLPNIIIGKHHTLNSPTNSPTIVVPFASNLGNFHVEVSLRTK